MIRSQQGKTNTVKGFKELKVRILVEKSDKGYDKIGTKEYPILIPRATQHVIHAPSPRSVGCEGVYWEKPKSHIG